MRSMTIMEPNSARVRATGAKKEAGEKKLYKNDKVDENSSQSEEEHNDDDYQLKIDIPNIQKRYSNPRIRFNSSGNSPGRRKRKMRQAKTLELNDDLNHWNTLHERKMGSINEQIHEKIFKGRNKELLYKKLGIHKYAPSSMLNLE